MTDHGWAAADAAGRGPARGERNVSSTGKTVAWLVAAAAVAANAAGYAFDLYQQFWWFDRVLHAFTIFAITLWLAVIVFAPSFQRGHNVRTFFLVASVGLAVGALWEVAEWAYDRIAPHNVIQGKLDTILDIVMDTVGAVAAALLCHRFWR